MADGKHCFVHRNWGRENKSGGGERDVSEGDERSNFTMNFFVQQFVNDSMFFACACLKDLAFVNAWIG